MMPLGDRPCLDLSQGELPQRALDLDSVEPRRNQLKLPIVESCRTRRARF